MKAAPHEAPSGSVSGASARVAFQGAHGAFTEEAAQAWFGAGGVVGLPCTDFAAVAAAVQSDRAEFGIFPVANLIAGPVTASLDVLARTHLTTVAEFVHPIRMYLLGVGGATQDGIRQVLSHPVALAQCGRFLGGMPRAQALEFFDTAGAAREVARRGDVRVAALAPCAAADRYGLRVLAGNVQDRRDNHTHFIVVRKRMIARLRPGKLSVPCERRDTVAGA